MPPGKTPAPEPKQNPSAPDSRSADGGDAVQSGGSYLNKLIGKTYAAQSQALAPKGSNTLGMRGAPDLDPGRFLEKNPQLVEGSGSKTDKKAPEKSTRSNATSYDAQPEALREVMERSFPENASSVFSALSDPARSNLTYTYNRMVEYGLWGHVRVIRGFVEGEKPAKVGPLELHVAGKSESILFEVYDGKALVDTMLTSGVFGKDVGPTGALHPGQTSMREWTLKTPDGLHLSVGPENDADAHIDKKSPTNKPKGQTSQMDVVRSLEHHWQEVWPEFLRLGPGWLVQVPFHVYSWLVDKTKFFGVGDRFRKVLKQIPKSLFEAAAFAVGIADPVFAGTTFKPADKVEHPDPSQKQKGSDFVVIKEYRFGSRGKKSRTPAAPPAGQSSMTEELTKAVLKAVSDVAPGIIKPAGQKGSRDDYADGETVGEAMAGKILYQAKAGGVSFGLELGPTYHTLKPAEVKDVKSQLTVIGKAVREAMLTTLSSKDDKLAQGVAGVRSGTVQLGPSLVRFSVH